VTLALVVPLPQWPHTGLVYQWPVHHQMLMKQKVIAMHLNEKLDWIGALLNSFSVNCCPPYLGTLALVVPLPLATYWSCGIFGVMFDGMFGATSC